MADMEQQLQDDAWKAAQSIPLSVDLVSAAKAHLRFLACINDLHPFLLQRGLVLSRAVQRYQNYWLPLLAVQDGSRQSLLPPLDCAWVWHCHKLNPLQYIEDCESRYGKLLDTPPITMDVEAAAKATQSLWNSLYPEEPYEVDLEHCSSITFTGNDRRKIYYDLESAVMRQASFFYQVSEAHMGEISFLNNALQRYRGYLYLVKLSGLRLFLVPTYDIDLMWHSHQNCPMAYKEDMLNLLGKVMNHDDTDSNRSKGQKLDTCFRRTKKFWQRTFGSMYERAGAIYRGEPPRPLSMFPPALNDSEIDLYSLTGHYDACLRLRETMQVFVTILGVRNVHTEHSGSLAVQLLFQKSCASLKLRTSWVKNGSGVQWDSSWGFQCVTSTEGLRFELLLQKSNCVGFHSCPSILGYVEFSWKALLDSPTLSWDGWVPLTMMSKSYDDCKPASLKISVSVTPPVIAPHLFRIETSVPEKNEESVMSGGHEPCITMAILDHTNREAFTTRICGWNGAGHFSPSKIQIIPGGSTDGSGTKPLIRELDTDVSSSRKWSLFDNAAQLVVTKNAGNSQENCHFSVHLTGPLSQSVRLVSGRRFQYQIAGATKDDEGGFMTLIRYTRDAPFGKTSAVLNWRSGVLEVLPGENVVLVLLLTMAIAYSVDDIQNITVSKTKWCATNSASRITSSDEWGSVILNACCSSCSEDMLKYQAWYSIGSSLWLSTFCNVGSDYGGCGNANAVHDSSEDSSGSCGSGIDGCGGGCGNANVVHDSSEDSSGSGCGGCGSDGCGGECGSGNAANNCDAEGMLGSRCGGCGSGGCGGGCENGNTYKECNAEGLLGSSCGGCGSGGCGGGCGNSNTANTYNAERVLASGCGGCGSGGCGNGTTAKICSAHCVLGSGCGGCGSGGCGGGCGSGNTALVCNSGVLGSGCGGCGSGGCGGGCGNDNTAKVFNSGVLGSGCGGCGSGGGCGNGNTAKVCNSGVLGSGCGGCGSGGCGGGCGNGNMAQVCNAQSVLGSGCGGCGSGGCGGGCGNGNMAQVCNAHVLGSGCGGCGSGGCGGGCGNGNMAEGSNGKRWLGSGCGGCGSGGCGGGCGNGNTAKVCNSVLGSGCGGCGSGGCGGGCGNGNMAEGSNSKHWRGSGCGGCGSGGCGGGCGSS